MTVGLRSYGFIMVVYLYSDYDILSLKGATLKLKNCFLSTLFFLLPESQFLVIKICLVKMYKR